MSKQIQVEYFDKSKATATIMSSPAYANFDVLVVYDARTGRTERYEVSRATLEHCKANDKAVKL